MRNHNKTLVVGLGKTGLSCVRYLSHQEQRVMVMDSRLAPPYLNEFKQQFPQIPLHLGPWSREWLAEADQIILSPGIALSEPAIAQQVAEHKSVVGDIELFVQHVQKPILAVTGTNGKTTVTALLGEMVAAAGLKVAVCGNIGKPVLEVLLEQAEEPDFYVLELSSFQLETTHSLKAAAAVVLNVSPDHLDRYPNYAAYIAAKKRIYQHCKIAVVNADQSDAWQSLAPAACMRSFSITNVPADFHLLTEQGQTYLAKQGRKLLNTNELSLTGRHHWQNALAALAMGDSVGLPMVAMQHALQKFKGLPHRCELIAKHHGVAWYNDSKATNMGATLAAITSLGQHIKGKIILIAGGQAKDDDFSDLLPLLTKYVAHVVLIGQDAALLERAFSPVVSTERAKTLKAATLLAEQRAKTNDAVLLSPACASFDMFDNYEHRGEVFRKIVTALE